MTICYSVPWVDDGILAVLANLPTARVTGSYARGEVRDDSDLDIRLGERDLRRFKAWLGSREFGSEAPGHITIDGIELFTGFHRQPKAQLAERVEINGRRFRTW